MAKAAKIKTIKIKQTGSPIGHTKKHKLVLESLGLKRIGHVREMPDNACVRGMVKKIYYMVSIVEDK